MVLVDLVLAGVYVAFESLGESSWRAGSRVKEV